MLRLRCHKDPQPKNGFTIVELAIVITIVPLMTSVFIMALYSSVVEARRSAAQAVYDSRANLAMDWVEKDIRYATAFTANVDNTKYPDTNDYAFGQDFSYLGTPSSSTLRSLILTLPATTAHPLDASRKLIHLEDPNGCAIPEYNPPLTYAAVYFVKDSTLYKRTIAPSTNTTVFQTCGANSPIQKTSCPRPGTGCVNGTVDEIVAKNVSQFIITYYDINGTEITDIYTNPARFSDAIAAKIDLQLKQPLSAKPAISNISLKTSRVN